METEDDQKIADDGTGEGEVETSLENVGEEADIDVKQRESSPGAVPSAEEMPVDATAEDEQEETSAEDLLTVEPEELDKVTMSEPTLYVVSLL